MVSDRLFGLFLIAFCVFLTGYIFPNYIETSENRVFTYFAVALIIIPSIVITIRSKGPLVTKITADKKKSLAYVAVLFVTYGAYLYCIDIVGYFTSSLIASIFFMYFLGERNIKFIVAIPLTVLALVYLLLEYTLQFLLPHGSFF